MKTKLNNLLKWLLPVIIFLISIKGWSQASVSHPFAVGTNTCTGSTSTIHYYGYNETTNTITNSTSLGSCTPLLKIGGSNFTFRSSLASVSYNPKDSNIYYFWTNLNLNPIRTYVWRWKAGSCPTSRIDTVRSFAYDILGVAFDKNGNGWMIEFGPTAPYATYLRSIDFVTGTVGVAKQLNFTRGAKVYQSGTGDVAISPSGQMFFVVDNKLFTPDYNSYSNTSSTINTTYIDTVKAPGTGYSLIGLTYAQGELITSYTSGSGSSKVCSYKEVKPITGDTSAVTPGTSLRSVSDFASVISGIGAAKKLVSAESVPGSTTKQYKLVYDIVIKNYGNYGLNTLQVKDTLSKINPAGSVSDVSVSFVGTPPPGLAINNSFNGTTNTSLLVSTNQNLSAYPISSNSFTIRIVCTISNIMPGVMYNNSATVTAKGFNAVDLNDVSTNGSSPDLNTNDKPDDLGESQPTPLLVGVESQTPPCASLSTTLYSQDFGTGTSNIATLPTPPLGSAGTTQYTGSTAQPLAIDHYMITNNVNNADNSRFISLTDHTGGLDGRMMVVNADASSNIIYSGTVNGLCAQQQYSLFFYAAFAGNSNYQTVCDAFGGFRYPRIKMRIIDAVTGLIITEMTTADITSTSWNQYGMKWVMPSNFSSVKFELINDGQGGCGNDIAIDDIQLGLCDPMPTVTLVNTSSGCIGGTTQFTATLNDAGVIPGAKDYQWQISTDNTNWTDISGATAQTYSIPTLTASDVSKYYRVIVAVQGNIASLTCKYFSPSYLLDAKTVSTAPEEAVASINNICPGDQVTLTVQGGSLGSGAVWRWYTESCGGTLVGTGASINVNPAANTTYYVRAEDDCNTTACAQVAILISCNPLPCNDIKLKAEVISYALVKLNWSLTCDQETSEFILERKDVGGFVAVHKEKGIFNNNQVLRYEAFDDLSGTRSDEIFYRVQSISKDGYVDYSSLIKVKLKQSPDKVQVITNPVHAELKVLVEMASASDGQFELWDGNGRIVKRYLQPVVAGINYVKMDVSNLPSGTYYFSAMLQGKVYNRKVYVIK